MAKIYITGITGFLGSNIARYLIDKGNEIIATYREGSSKQRCADYSDKVIWILQDDGSWAEQVCCHSPQVIIHTGWIGVEHGDRNSWDVQFLNIDYLHKVLYIARQSGSAKFISLGSQAEYGAFSGIVDENYPLNPNEAYGRVKIICSEIVKQYCNCYNIDWYWLRIFSIFGRGESEKWLIPLLVKKMHTSMDMDLTAGEQKYAYLYVDDLAYAVNSITTNSGPSGVYNISGKNVLTLRLLIESVRNSINKLFRLNFGALPYRANQPMHVQGDVSRFIDTFGEFEVSDFGKALSDTLEYLKNDLN